MLLARYPDAAVRLTPLKVVRAGPVYLPLQLSDSAGGASAAEAATESVTRARRAAGRRELRRNILESLDWIER